VLDRAWLRRTAVLVIAAAAGLAYGWQANRDTLEIYYAAAVRSMSMSWHDFIFGGFDPAGTVTLDKLPGAFWIEALAVRAFGVHTWVLIAPQAAEGVFALAYLIDGPGAAGRRVRQLAAGGLVAVAVSLAWMTAVTLVPSADRPYADGSHDNSVFQQVFVYNGFGRLGEQTPLQLLAGTIRPGIAYPVAAAGPQRLLTGVLGRDAGWLLLPAVVAALWALARRFRAPRGDPRRACLVLWGGWLLVLGVTFSVTTAVNPYYTAALSPAVAALLAVAVTMAWSSPPTWPLRIGVAAVVAATAAYAAWLIPAGGTDVASWLVKTVIVAGVIAAVLALAAPARNYAAALAVALASVLLVPAVASAELIGHDQGALDTPFEPSRLAASVDDFNTSLARVQQVTALRLVDAAEGDPDLAATQTSAVAAVFIYATGREVLPIGGFTGTIPEPTLGQLQADIRDRKFRLVIAFSTADARLAWIESNCVGLARPTWICAPSEAGGQGPPVARAAPPVRSPAPG